MTEQELREKFIGLSAAQLKEFGVEGSPYLVNQFAVLVWNKFLPFITQYGDQHELAGRIDELEKHKENHGDCATNCMSTCIAELKAKQIKGVEYE